MHMHVHVDGFACTTIPCTWSIALYPSCMWSVDRIQSVYTHIYIYIISESGILFAKCVVSKKIGWNVFRDMQMVIHNHKTINNMWPIGLWLLRSAVNQSLLQLVLLATINHNQPRTRLGATMRVVRCFYRWLGPVWATQRLPASLAVHKMIGSGGMNPGMSRGAMGWS